MEPDCTLCFRGGMIRQGNVVEAGHRTDATTFFRSANRVRQTLRTCGRWQNRSTAPTGNLPPTPSNSRMVRCHSEWLRPIPGVTTRYGRSVYNLPESL